MKQPSAEDTSGTVARVIRLLQCIAESSGEVSVKELSRRLALPPSTVHRQLQLLSQSGIVERRIASHSYRTGREFFRICSLVLKQFDVRDLVRRFLEELRDSSGETAFFVMYLPATHQATIVEVVRSPNPLRHDLEPFTYRPLTWGSSGRSILAHLPEAMIGEIIARADPSPAAGKPLPGPNVIRAELRRIRRCGYAMSRGQNLLGAVGIASAVFDADAKVLGSIGLTIPDVRFNPAKADKLAAMTVAEARRVSASLGYRGDDKVHRQVASA